MPLAVSHNLMDGEPQWSISVLADRSRLSAVQEQTLRNYLIAPGKRGVLIHRSRHASTIYLRLGLKAGGRLEVFIKLFDPPRGITFLKSTMRRSPSDHVVHISNELQQAGFGVPEVLMIGRERGGREMLMTARADGEALPALLMARGEGARERKRAALRTLGAEIARLHRCGFVHGDLTPFNVVVVCEQPQRLVFLDHERTRRTRLARYWRPRLRNLVQLGHYDLPGVTRSDRMRVFHAYAPDLDRTARKTLMRKVLGMIEARGWTRLPQAPAAKG